MAASPPSADVEKNEDGTYTVVNARNDGDNNIYQVNSQGRRMKDDKGNNIVIGTTMRPYDFMSTDDATGAFTFDLKNLTVSGTVSPNKYTTATIKGADAQRLLNWGQELFNNEVNRQLPATFYGKLEILKVLSANGGALDFKVSLGVDKYSALSAGNTSDGKPIITTLRAIGNMTFGANVHSTTPGILTDAYYYRKVMGKVGAYNQSQNGGNGYNSGAPYYGEHSYSGSYIYYGYFGKFYSK